MANGTEEQIDQLIQAVNDIADLIPTSAEASPLEMAGQPGTLGGLALDQVVDANIGRILGSTPSKDPQRIVDLLTAAFEKKRGGPAGDYQWRQRGSVPVEGLAGGQISGEQATLYQELKEREEAANRLLDAVVPVILDPDEDEINEVKDRIRMTLTSLVTESGRPGGAVLDVIEVRLETLDSDLRELKAKLGLDETRAELKKEFDFATEEQIRANFGSLETTYIGKAVLEGVLDRLKRANNSSATRLSRLLRAIEGIPNTVQQVYTVMNSVRFGAAERRVTGVESDTDTTTFEQLFNWIEQSASTDWPTSLIGGGARRSEVLAVRLAAERQSVKLNKLIRNGNARLDKVIDVGVKRVSTVIAELRRELEVVKDLTSEIVGGLPDVQAVTPESGSTLGGELVTITGVNLQKVKKVTFGGVEGTIIQPIDQSGNSIKVTTPAHAPGVVDLKVEGDDGSDTLTDGFTYAQPAANPPVAKNIFPNRGQAHGGDAVVIVGSNLAKTQSVTFGGGQGVPPTYKGPQGEFIEVKTPPHRPATVEVMVIDDQGRQSTVPDGFTYVQNQKTP